MQFFLMTREIGDEYLSSTKYQRGNLPGHQLDWSTKPSVYKEYDGSMVISLPDPVTQGGSSVWDLVNARRSVRAYDTSPLSLVDLSQVLWATQGITATTAGHELRAAPSAGALYPIETYLYVNRVESLEQGIYHYRVDTHSLELLKKGDHSKAVRGGALDQAMVEAAPVVFIWTAIFQRSKWKYLQRAYRYVFLDAGHIAQNLALAAQALGLGSCQIGAIYDEEINAILDLDGLEESVIYMSTLGKPRRAKV